MDLFGLDKVPPPPIGQYVWVKTKEGSFWRKKRGSCRPALLNDAFQQGSHAMKISAPAASRIMRRLSHHLNRLQTGRLNARISARMRKALKEQGKLCLTYLKGMDLQPKHPLGNLLKMHVLIEQDAQEVRVRIPVNADTVLRLNEIVTAYYFELILLWGDAGSDKGLRVDEVDSPVYRIEEDYNTECRLSLVLPPEGQQWIALVKVNCIEGRELAIHPKHYGMKVIAVRGM